MPGFGDAADHFEYEFEVSATLDAEVRRVCATWLRIGDVEYSELMDRERKSELMVSLGAGHRIVDGGSSTRRSLCADET